MEKCQEHVTVQAGRARIPTPLKNLGPITVGHGMVTRVGPNGETLVWYRKVSCCPRCRLEARANESLQTSKDGHGRPLKNVEINLDSRQVKGARQKCESGEKSHEQRVQEVDGRIRSLRCSWRKKVCLKIAKQRRLEDRGRVPEEEGDYIRQNRSTHEEHFLSCWLWEDVERKVEGVEKMNKEATEEEEETLEAEI